MARLQGAEFTKTTLKDALTTCESKCQKCQRKLTRDQITAHHILPIWYAKIFFPLLSN